MGISSIYLFRDEEYSGPFSLQQVRSMYIRGAILSRTLYYTEETAEWRDIDLLFSSAENTGVALSPIKPTDEDAAPRVAVLTAESSLGDLSKSQKLARKVVAIFGAVIAIATLIGLISIIENAPDVTQVPAKQKPETETAPAIEDEKPDSIKLKQGKNYFALFHVSNIPRYMASIDFNTNSPVIEAYQQIYKTQLLVARSEAEKQVAQDEEMGRIQMLQHKLEISAQDDFVKQNLAIIIPPGTYEFDSAYDTSGNPTDPSGNEVAFFGIHYNGAVVCVLVGSDIN